MELTENSPKGNFYPLNTITLAKSLLALALAFGLAGGAMTLVLNELDATAQGKKTATVKDLLRAQNPGQISYISFPITEHLAEQLNSDRKFIRFPGERYRSP